MINRQDNPSSKLKIVHDTLKECFIHTSKEKSNNTKMGKFLDVKSFNVKF